MHYIKILYFIKAAHSGTSKNTLGRKQIFGSKVAIGPCYLDDLSITLLEICIKTRDLLTLEEGKNH